MAGTDDGFDVLLTTIGFGRWQAPIILATVLIAAQLPIHLIGSSLLSAPMAFHCSPTPPADNQSAVDALRSNSSAVYFNSTCLSFSVNNTEDIMVSDEIYNGTGYFTGLPLCPYVEYDTSIFTSTIISQFHLICDQSELRPLFQMMYNIGGLIGSSLGGFIGDRFGRKRAVQVGCVGHLIAVVLAVVIPSYSLVLCMRFIIGVMMPVMLLPAWSLALEVTPSRHRSLVGMLMGVPYSITVIMGAGIAYFIRTWEYLLLTNVLPGIILFPLAIYIDDSPSWLLQKGRVEKATKVLKNAVKLNEAKLSTPIETIVKKLAETTTSPEGEAENKEISKTFSSRIQEMMTYFRSPAMRIILLLSPLFWFMQSFLYLAVAINANNFTSSGPFLYVALTGAMDGSAIILSTPLATRIGRKIMLFTGMFGGAVLFLLDLLVPKEYYGAKWMLVMGGFLLVASAFQVNFVYTPELFPTETRARGFGFLNLVGNIGYICAPIITEIFAKYSWWAAGVIFGCAGILGSFAVPLLPETRNIPLPETLQDVEDRRNNARNKSKKKEDKGVNNLGFSEQAEKSV